MHECLDSRARFIDDRSTAGGSAVASVMQQHHSKDNWKEKINTHIRTESQIAATFGGQG
jgi:hypothetical protein